MNCCSQDTNKLIEQIKVRSLRCHSPFCSRQLLVVIEAQGVTQRWSLDDLGVRVEFPGEARKLRGQEVACTLHLDAEVAKNDDRGWEGRETLR